MEGGIFPQPKDPDSFSPGSPRKAVRSHLAWSSGNPALYDQKWVDIFWGTPFPYDSALPMCAPRGVNSRRPWESQRFGAETGSYS